MGEHRMKYLCLSLLLFATAVTIVLGQESSSSLAAGNLCSNRDKCGVCLQGVNCVWCKDPKFLIEDKSYTRCNTREGHRGKCSDQQLVTLLPASADGGEGAGTGTGDGGRKQNTIQPSTYKVKLGVGQRINITLDYTDPGNKPLDLYYLMDLSHTMKVHKDSVQKLGRELASALNKTTTNLQIGFGSFIDKPIMPYATVADITPKANHVPTYGFQNHLKLTGNVTKFEEVVREAQISGNFDAPEGGLDAIMQAIECQEEIGWRNDSHHVLVVSTDGSFHIAGDGKLAGLVIPNDGRCHMSNHFYSKSTELDYPSISQVIAKIREHKAHTIFAVTEEQVPLYRELSQLEPGYAITVKFDATSSNAKEIISNQYKLIRETVQLSPDKLSILQLRYFAKCNQNDDFEADKFTCQNVGPQSTLKFIVQLELLKCPPNTGQWKSHFDISPTSSTFNEILRVHYELQCGCECEDVDDPSPTGASGADGFNNACTNPEQGTVRCGVCHCKEGAYIGEKCQCPLAANETNSQSYLTEDKCKNLDSGLTCSNRGKCECGQCVTCEDGFNGKFCECESRRCRPSYNNNNNRISSSGGGGGGSGSNLECSGHDHGTCFCDKCVCHTGDTGVSLYTGDYCECEKSTRNCQRGGGGDSSGDHCNGHGTCECNRCQCDQKAWDGKYCDVCVSPINSEICGCPPDLQEYISCLVQDKEIEATPEHNVTEYKLALKEDYQVECEREYKELKFDVLELQSIDFMADNEFNEPNAGRDENVRIKKCSTKLKSDYRPNCVIEYVYSIGTPIHGSGLSSSASASAAGSSYKETLKISIRQSPTCSPPPAQQDPLVIVLGTSAGVVLIGLLTLILWKIITYFHDKREYTRFEMERKGAKWDASGNPLYSEPISTFQNPAYRE